MNIELTSGQIALVHITIEAPSDGFELYGGTQKGDFQIDYTGSPDYEWLCTIREADVVGTPLGTFNIYARELSSGREWVILSGKIIVKPRTASVPADKLHPVEYFITVPIKNEQVDAAGNVIVQGIPGPKGDKGDKGEPGEGGMTAEERALLNGAAQRDADNTFSAANTFTGEVDMSAASVTPPEGWNVAELTPEAIQAVVPIAWGSNATPPTVNASNSLTIGDGAKNYWSSSVAIGVGAISNEHGNTVLGNDASANGQNATAVGLGAKCHASHSVALGRFSTTTSTYPSLGLCVAIGSQATTKKPLNITIGSAFEDTSGKFECTTQGTGSITIGAGANTLNTTTTVDGVETTVESSNSITIGCKAENKGADSVVIGAQAKGAGAATVAIGVGASAKKTVHWGSGVAVGARADANMGGVAIGERAALTHGYGVAVGLSASAGYSGTAVGTSTNSPGQSVAVGYGATCATDSIAIGCMSTASTSKAIALGFGAKAADYGATVIRSTAEDGTITQLYFSGANTPLANTYANGEAIMGYVTKDNAGNPIASGFKRLSALFDEGTMTQPATLDENGEWVQPKVFHPSDLDIPVEEPIEEPDEYTPLPVYPIVEPEIEEIPSES